MSMVGEFIGDMVDVFSSRSYETGVEYNKYTLTTRSVVIDDRLYRNFVVFYCVVEQRFSVQLTEYFVEYHSRRNTKEYSVTRSIYEFNVTEDTPLLKTVDSREEKLNLIIKHMDKIVEYAYSGRAAEIITNLRRVDVFKEEVIPRLSEIELSTLLGLTNDELNRIVKVRIVKAGEETIMLKSSSPFK